MSNEEEARQDTPPVTVQTIDKPHVVERRHHGLAGSRRRDQQVRVAPSLPLGLKLVEHELLVRVGAHGQGSG